MSKSFDDIENPLPQQDENNIQPNNADELAEPLSENSAQESLSETTVYDQEDYGYDEEEDYSGSTVFSATPIEHNAPKKGSRKLRNIIAAILVLCILCGSVFAIIKFIPSDDKAAEGSSSVAALNVKLVSVQEENIKSLTVSTASGSYTAYPGENTLTASSGSGIVWGIDGIGSEILNTATVGTMVSGATDVSALRLMASGVDDLSIYGLNTPYMTLTVTGYNSSDGYTLYFGGDSPTGEGKYAYLKGSSDVYLISSTTVTNFDHDKKYFVNTKVISAMTAETENASYFDEKGILKRFDSIVVSGTNYASPITIQVNSNDVSSYIPYIMTTPVKQNVMGAAGDALLSPIKSGLTADGAYEVYPDEATVAKYGLDNPAIVVNYAVGTYQKVLKISPAPGDSSYYAVMFDNSPVIYKVAKSILTFADYKVEEYFNNYIFLDDITTVKSVSVNTAAGSHVYNLTHGTDQDDNATLEVTCDGKVLDTGSFRNLYQYMISCYASDFTMEPAPAASDSRIEIKINFLDDAREDIDAVYVQSSDRRYHITVNGVPLGYAFATTVNNLISYENGYFSGQSVAAP